MSMNSKIEAAGYIVHREEWIWGLGATIADARADFEAQMREGMVRIVEDGEASPDDGSSWTRRANYHLAPATAALLAEVRGCGGDMAWEMLEGVACTEEEADAA